MAVVAIVIALNVGGIRTSGYFYRFMTRDGGILKNIRFQMIYEAIMNDLEIYKNIEPAKHINKPSLNLILEEIEKPQYIVCESSGRSILLEEAIFMDEDYLIT
jgi:hypothetical protein